MNKYKSIKPFKQKTVMSNDTSLAYAYFENVLVQYINSAPNPQTGKRVPLVFAKTIGGYTIDEVISGVTGSCNGRMKYVAIGADPYKERIIFGYEDKIFLKTSAGITLLRDVDADGYSIEFLQGQQFGRFGYVSIADETLTGHAYIYRPLMDITAVADNGSGDARFTVAGHGLLSGDSLDITQTTDYNGTHTIVVISANTFDVTSLTYVSDQTGKADFDGLALQTMSGLPAIQGFGRTNNRLTAIEYGEFANNVLGSEVVASGYFRSFTVGTSISSGVEFSGIENEVSLQLYSKATTFCIEEGRISAHKIEYMEVGSTLTLNPETTYGPYTMDGVGTKSKYGGVVGPNGELYIADEENKSVYMYTLGRYPKLVNLSEYQQDFFTQYDMTDSSVQVDKKRRLLYVTASSVADGVQDTVLVYNFDTKVWSVDTGKTIKFITTFYDSGNTWGFDNLDPKTYSVYDGTFTNLGAEIACELRSYPFTSGDQYNENDYDRSAILFGIQSEEDEIYVSYYKNELPDADYTTMVDLSNIDIDKTSSPFGAYGKYALGLGSRLRENDPRNTATWTRFRNDAGLSLFSTLSVGIKFSTKTQLFVFEPKLMMAITDDDAEDVD